MKFLMVIFMMVNIAHAGSWDGKVLEVKTNATMTQAEYLDALSHFSIIVLGEKHYTPAVQMAQAKTIRNMVQQTGKVGAFTTGWEFLNVTSQNETEQLFLQVKSKTITSEIFLQKTQGATKEANSYGPIIDVTAELGGDLLGLNLSRQEKTPVTERGIEALDPKLLPPDFDYGTSGYYERFSEQMQGHATPNQVKNYYASQCLVDDTMAYHLLKDSLHELNFIIAGSFHTDYYDGAVNRIKIRNPNASIVTVKIIDASDFSSQELDEEMNDIIHSDRYGDIADYVYFVNEPQ